MSPTEEPVLVSQSMLQGVWFHHLCLQATWPSLLIIGLPIKFGPDTGWCVVLGAVYSAYTAGRKHRNSHWNNYVAFYLQRLDSYESRYKIFCSFSPCLCWPPSYDNSFCRIYRKLSLLLTWLAWSCYQATTLMQALFHISKLLSLTSPVFPLVDCPVALWRCTGDSSALSEQN